jgi:hypothetical protein
VSVLEKENTGMERLLLVSVFWESHDQEAGEDEIVHVEDGIVIYITRPDSLEVAC